MLRASVFDRSWNLLSSRANNGTFRTLYPVLPSLLMTRSGNVFIQQLLHNIWIKGCYLHCSGFYDHVKVIHLITLCFWRWQPWIKETKGTLIKLVTLEIKSVPQNIVQSKSESALKVAGITKGMKSVSERRGVFFERFPFVYRWTKRHDCFSSRSILN